MVCWARKTFVSTVAYTMLTIDFEIISFSTVLGLCYNLVPHYCKSMPISKKFSLRDPWSFLAIVFVGQCEEFVCLGFV